MTSPAKMSREDLNSCLTALCVDAVMRDRDAVAKRFERILAHHDAMEAELRDAELADKDRSLAFHAVEVTTASAAEAVPAGVTARSIDRGGGR